MAEVGGGLVVLIPFTTTVGETGIWLQAVNMKSIAKQSIFIIYLYSGWCTYKWSRACGARGVKSLLLTPGNDSWYGYGWWVAPEPQNLNASGRGG